MQSMSRRSLLAGILALPIFGNLKPKFDNINFQNRQLAGICILGKIFRENRFDLTRRFFKVVQETYPDISSYQAAVVICRRMELEGWADNKIHFVEIVPGHTHYYAHFHYINSDNVLAEPIV